MPRIMAPWSGEQRPLKIVPHVDPAIVLGAIPAPWGGQVFGVVAHPNNGGWGVLVRLPDGIYVHVAEGAVRSLPQDAAAEAARRFAN